MNVVRGRLSDHPKARLQFALAARETGFEQGEGVAPLAGLLAGLGMLAISGLGPVVAAGWLVSTAALAVTGGAAGGLIGSLTQHGVDEDEDNAYAEGVRRGGTLVTARVPEELKPI